MTTAITPIAVGTWVIDPVHSSVDFSVRQSMVSKVRGTFENFSGTITVDPDGTRSVTAQIDVASLNTGNEQRDRHVKSSPRTSSTSRTTRSPRSRLLRCARCGHSEPTTSSTVTSPIKGVTKPVSLDAEFNGVCPGQGHGQVSGYEAPVVLSRKDFGIDIPMETRGAVVGDKFAITRGIEVVKQSRPLH